MCASYPFLVYPCAPDDLVWYFRTIYGERLDDNRYRFHLPEKIGWNMPHSMVLNYVRSDDAGEQKRFAVSFSLGTAWHEERPTVCPQRVDVPGADGSGLSVTVKQRKAYCFGLKERLR